MGRSLHHAPNKATTMPNGSITGNTPSRPAGPILATPLPAHLQTPPVGTRSSARRRQSTSTSSTAPATPSTPGPVTPVATPPSYAQPNSAGPSRLHSKSYVEPKNHQTRNHGDKDRQSCPFPEEYGGQTKCGVADADAEDDVLMACCAALAQAGNRALMPEDIARIVFEENAWLRAPSAAIERSTPIVTAIRLHTKRCERDGRANLFGKVQLHGSVGESILESALLPEAFEKPSRPRGHVYYLATVGQRKWKNPFEGLDLSFLTVKKPSQPKKKQVKAPSAPRPIAPQVKKADSIKSSGTPPPAKQPERKITLRIAQNGTGVKMDADGDDEREVTAAALPPRPRAPSRTFSASSRATITLAPGLRKSSSRHAHRADGMISSDESGSSESEAETHAQPRVKARKPPPLPLHTASPFAHYSPRSPHNYLPSPGLPQSPMFAAPTPCPSHSLDNTTWTVRRDQDPNAQFETSSSSSDDEMRESDWGMASGIVIRDGAGDDSLIWSAAEDESQIKEATDALRVLFPMASPEEERDSDPMADSARYDSFPPASDTASLAESTSTTTAHPCAKSRKGMKARECATVPLAAWSGNSSPIASPHFRPATLPIDVSPTQHLSRLRDSFEPSEMDMEVDNPVWVDESGEGPVKSPDDSFDDHLSNAGEPALEQEKQNDLFAWACEAAASRNQMQVKQEPEDYPSPLTTDDGSGGYAHGSRASSAALETRSSSSSELDLPELDSMDCSRFDLQELLIGPESVTIDELEGWLPPNKEKTPRRKGRRDVGLTLANLDFGSGPIGVGNRQALMALKGGSKLVRKRSARSRRTGAGATQLSPIQPTPSQLHALSPFNATSPSELTDLDDEPAETDFDMIGTEELEHARAEAEAKEESSRKLAQERADRQRACLEACKALRPGSAACEFPPTPWLDHPSPFDFPGAWGHASTESLHVCTPAPSVLSPVMLQSVAGLTLNDHVGGPKFGVDPKHLVSPTFHPEMFGPPIPPFPPVPPPADHAMFNLEEMVSLAEAEVGLSPPVNNILPPLAPPQPTANANSPASVPVPSRAAEEEVKDSPTLSTAPSTAKPMAKVEIEQAVSMPPPTTASSTATTSLTSSPVPTAKIATRSLLANSMYTPGDESAYHGSVSILKNVCDGVLATVVDNIPVYVHVAGPIPYYGKVDVFRRLDSDFVNITTLLIALGVPVDQHEKYLNQPDWDTKAHVTMAPSIQGHKYAPGVQGKWIRLSQAQDVARQLGLVIGNNAAGGLGNVLRDDLFQVFATMANLNPKHTPSDNFGCSTFLPEPLQEKKKAGASTVSGSDTTKSSSTTTTSGGSAPVSASSSSLAASSAHSKSTPNLTALSSSAPASGPGVGPRKAANKATLVRQTPSTPLEPGPQPKRRRATIVEGVAPKMSPLTSGPAVKKTGSQSPPNASGSTISPTIKAGLTPVPIISSPAANLRKPIPSKSSQISAPTASPSVTQTMTPIQKRATRASLGHVGMTTAKAIK